jgi:hypothetical protein
MRTPKVIFGVSGEDVVLRNANAPPDVPGLKVRLQTLLEVAFKVGHVESVFGELVNFGQ